MKKTVVLLSALTLAACTQKPKEAKIEPAPVAVPASRSEPIFYNGKTYQLSYTRNAAGVYAMTVRGMSAKQKSDAVAVATSSLRYFACRDGQEGKLLNTPSYASSAWKMTAACN
jgi:hypothetical protein